MKNKLFLIILYNIFCYSLFCNDFANHLKVQSCQEEFSLIKKIIFDPDFLCTLKHEKLLSSYTNDSYKVSFNDSHYFIRKGNNHPGFLGINRYKELFFYNILSLNNLVPKIIYFDYEKDIMLMKYLNGKAFLPQDLQNIKILKRIVKILQQIHSIQNYNQEKVYCYKIIESYVQTINKLNIKHSIDINNLLKFSKKIESIKFQNNNICLCHNDLFATNFFEEKNKIWLLDWEYADWGDFFFDLASLCEENDLSNDLKLFVLGEYFKNSVIKDNDLFHFQAMCCLYNIKNILWSIIQSYFSPNNKDFLQKITKSQYNKFLSNEKKITVYLNDL